MTDDAIDYAVLEDLEDSMGADFAADLVKTFLEEAPGMLDALRQADEGGDIEGFRRAAHSIKSNANIFGATGLAAQARDLELNGPQPDGITALTKQFSRAETALKGFLDGA